MILLNDVIEVLTGSYLDVAPARMLTQDVEEQYNHSIASTTWCSGSTTNHEKNKESTAKGCSSGALN